MAARVVPRQAISKCLTVRGAHVILAASGTVPAASSWVGAALGRDPGRRQGCQVGVAAPCGRGALMDSKDILLDGYARIPQLLGMALDSLTAEQLAYRPTEQANSIAWLVWHLTRVQDKQVSDLAGR